MKKTFKILLIVVFISTCTFAQKDESVVAQIGNEKITSKDFKLRYELSPFVSIKSSWNQDSLKHDFFYSLIAEKIWALKAEELGFANKEDFYFYFKPLEDIYIRDALFKEEIEKKVVLTASDINGGIIKYQTDIKVKIISSGDSSLIFTFYSKLEKTNDIDSLLFQYTRLESTRQYMDIRLGTLKDEEIEDKLYGLNIDDFTKPIKSEIGWVIFHIEDKSSAPIDLNDEKSINDIKKIIRTRRIENRYNEYLKSLLSGIRISANEESFYLAANQIVKRFSVNKYQAASSNSKNEYRLDEGDYREIRLNLGESNLSETLFTVSENDITVRDFLANLAFKEFSVDKLDSTAIVEKLKLFLKFFIEEQMITQEAYKMKLNNAPEVKGELEMWKGNYLAQMLKVCYLDSINLTDADIYDYYLNDIVKNSNIILINVQLISLTDLDEIAKILEQIKVGNDFGEVIKPYGKTDSLVNEQGETGLKPLILLEDVGLMANKLKVGQLYGPIRRQNRYSLFMVKEQEQSSDTLKLSFASSKEVLKNQLRLKKLNEIISQKTVDFISNKNFKVYEDILNSTKTSQIQMFVHRLMGFGGRIAAVPLTDNWADWINTYELKKKLLP